MSFLKPSADSRGVCQLEAARRLKLSLWPVPWEHSPSCTRLSLIRGLCRFCNQPPPSIFHSNSDKPLGLYNLILWVKFADTESWPTLHRHKSSLPIFLFIATYATAICVTFTNGSHLHPRHASTPPQPTEVRHRPTSWVHSWPECCEIGRSRLISATVWPPWEQRENFEQMKSGDSVSRNMRWRDVTQAKSSMWLCPLKREVECGGPGVIDGRCVGGKGATLIHEASEASRVTVSLYFLPLSLSLY